MFAPHRFSALLCLVVLCWLILPARLTAQQPPSPSVAALISRAGSGDGEARKALLQFLMHGDPASSGFDSAVTWLRSLASQDSPAAEVVLGYLYEKGRGLPHDYVKAAENYQAAVLHKNPFAQNNLAFLYQHGFGVSKDLHRAFELSLAAAQQNDRYAQCSLATMYYSGSGVPRNDREAARWFRAAAELGDPVAQHFLAVFHSQGIGVPVDFKQAAYWENLSAHQGFALAETGLALFYENGRGLSLDYVSAYAWYSRALSSGDESAAANLKSLSKRMTPKQRDDALTYLASLPGPTSNSSAIEQADAAPLAAH